MGLLWSPLVYATALINSLRHCTYQQLSIKIISEKIRTIMSSRVLLRKTKPDKTQKADPNKGHAQNHVPTLPLSSASDDGTRSNITD